MKRIGMLMMGLMVAMGGMGGCGNGDKAETIAGPQGQKIPESSDLVPDIALEDVNPSSSLFGAKVSPRNFLGQVSAWYFGHAT